MLAKRKGHSFPGTIKHISKSFPKLWSGETGRVWQVCCSEHSPVSGNDAVVVFPSDKRLLIPKGSLKSEEAADEAAEDVAALMDGSALCLQSRKESRWDQTGSWNRC